MAENPFLDDDNTPTDMTQGDVGGSPAGLYDNPDAFGFSESGQDGVTNVPRNMAAERRPSRISAFGSSGDGRLSRYENGMSIDQYVAGSQAARRLADYAGYNKVGQSLTNLVMNQRQQKARKQRDNSAFLGWGLDASRANGGHLPKECLAAFSQQFGMPIGGGAFNGSDYVLFGADQNGNLQLDRNGRPVAVASVPWQQQMSIAKKTGQGMKNAQAIYDGMAGSLTPEQLSASGITDPKSWTQQVANTATKGKSGQQTGASSGIAQYNESGELVGGDLKMLTDEINALMSMQNRSQGQQAMLERLFQYKNAMVEQRLSQYMPKAEQPQQKYRPKGQIAGQGDGRSTVWYRDQNGSVQRAEVGRQVMINGIPMIFDNDGVALTIQEASQRANEKLAELRKSGKMGGGTPTNKSVPFNTSRDEGQPDSGTGGIGKNFNLNIVDDAAGYAYGEPDVSKQPKRPIAVKQNKSNVAEKKPQVTEAQYENRRLMVEEKFKTEKFRKLGGTVKNVPGDGGDRFILGNYEFLPREDRRKWPKESDSLEPWHESAQAKINELMRKFEESRKAQEEKVLAEANSRFPNSRVKRDKYVEQEMEKWDVKNDPRDEGYRQSGWDKFSSMDIDD